MQHGAGVTSAYADHYDRCCPHQADAFTRARGSGRKQAIDVRERLELDRVAAGITEHHARLLVHLRLVTDVRLEEERHALPAQSRGERAPPLPLQHDAEVRQGNRVAVDAVLTDLDWPVVKGRLERLAAR